MNARGTRSLAEGLVFVWESSTKRGETWIEFHSAQLAEPRGLTGLETMIAVLERHGFAFEGASLRLMRADRSSGLEPRGTAFYLSGHAFFVRDGVRLVLEPAKPEGLYDPTDLLAEMFGARPQPMAHGIGGFGTGPDEGAQAALFEVREARPAEEPLPAVCDAGAVSRTADAVRAMLSGLPFDVPAIAVAVRLGGRNDCAVEVRREPGHVPAAPLPDPRC